MSTLLKHFFIAQRCDNTLSLWWCIFIFSKLVRWGFERGATPKITSKFVWISSWQRHGFINIKILIYDIAYKKLYFSNIKSQLKRVGLIKLLIISFCLIVFS